MNYMKLNTDKCHLLLSGNKNYWAKLDQDNDVELLGVTIDNNLRFDMYQIFKSRQKAKCLNKSS